LHAGIAALSNGRIQVTEEKTVRRKRPSAQLFENAGNCFEVEKNSSDLERLIKISLRDSSQEERVQEASKPLYLRRYE
jgi:hypothetical protein